MNRLPTHSPLSSREVVRRRRRAGFTMIELVIVILIIVICTTLALQGYAAFLRNQTASSGASKLRRAMATARAFAQAHGTSFRVTIDRQAMEFWIDRTGTLPSEETAPTPNTQVVVDPITGDAIQVGQAKIVHPEAFPTDVILAEVRSVESYQDAAFDLIFVIFRPDGSCRTNTVIQLLNQHDDPNDDGNYHTIRVAAPTGAIKVYPNQRL